MEEIRRTCVPSQWIFVGKKMLISLAQAVTLVCRPSRFPTVKVTSQIRSDLRLKINSGNDVWRRPIMNRKIKFVEGTDRREPQLWKGVNVQTGGCTGTTAPHPTRWRHKELLSRCPHGSIGQNSASTDSHLTKYPTCYDPRITFRGINRGDVISGLILSVVRFRCT
jgi:hypothetical protein